MEYQTVSVVSMHLISAVYWPAAGHLGDTYIGCNIVINVTNPKVYNNTVFHTVEQAETRREKKKNRTVKLV